MKLTKVEAAAPLTRIREAVRGSITVGCVQVSWQRDAEEHKANLERAIRLAHQSGAEIIFLPELTLSRYPADVCPTGAADATAEKLKEGETFSFVSQLAKVLGVYLHASLFERTGFEDSRGLNTAILVGPDGELVGRTPKLHIPVTEGYFEDQYFQQGPNQNPYPIWETPKAKLGMPTCWDEWFPEVARAYGLLGADILCYPTAIGSEPDHPNFDSEPLWRQNIVGHAIANGLFIVVPNRWGNEGLINFYGSSFIVDPYGRILARAGRDGDEVLVATLDLDQRRDWLELFPFFGTRRPDTYSVLTEPITNPRSTNGLGVNGGIPGLRP